jgi:hypothetical protein
VRPRRQARALGVHRSEATSGCLESTPCMAFWGGDRIGLTKNLVVQPLLTDAAGQALELGVQKLLWVRSKIHVSSQEEATGAFGSNPA